jgi:hypothetical protein
MIIGNGKTKLTFATRFDDTLAIKEDKTLEDYLVAPQTVEEDAIYEIREWYQGRHFRDALAERQEFISPIVYKMLSRYPFVNLVKTSVKVLNERLKLVSISSENQEKAELASEWWRDLEMDSWQGFIYEAALRDKACVVIVGWDGVKKRPTIAKNELWDGYNGHCRIVYDTNDNILFVSKRWDESDPIGNLTGRVRITVYFPDRIERYVVDDGEINPRLMTIEEIRAESPEIAQNPQPWVNSSGDPLGLAAIVFENRGYVSECEDAMTIQAALNDAVLDFHSNLRYHGIPTIVFQKVQFRIDPITGKPEKPKWGPGKALVVDDGDVKRIEPTNSITLYNGSIKPWIEMLAHQKRWPMHIFHQAPPSGETLRQMESALVSQCNDKKLNFSDSWQKVFDLCFKLYLEDTGVDLTEGRLYLRWDTSLGLNDAYDMNVLKTKKEVADLPQAVVLEELGYSKDRIEQIIDMRDDEKQRAAELFRQNQTMAFSGAKVDGAAEQRSQVAESDSEGSDSESDDDSSDSSGSDDLSEDIT